MFLETTVLQYIYWNTYMKFIDGFLLQTRQKDASCYSFSACIYVGYHRWLSKRNALLQQVRCYRDKRNAAHTLCSPLDLAVELLCRHMWRMSDCAWNLKEIAWMPEMHNGTNAQILVLERKRCSPWSKIVCGWTHELIQTGRTLQELSPIQLSGHGEWKSSGSTWVTRKNIDWLNCTPQLTALY